MSTHERFQRWTHNVKVGDTLTSRREPRRVVEVMAVAHGDTPNYDSITIQQVYGQPFERGGLVRTLLRRSLGTSWDPTPLLSMETVASRLRKILKTPAGATRQERIYAAMEYLAEGRVAIFTTIRGDYVYEAAVNELVERMSPKIETPRKPRSAKPEPEPAQPVQGELPLEFPIACSMTPQQVAELSDRVAAQVSAQVAERLLGDTRLVDLIARVVLAALDEGTASDDQRAQAFVEKVRAMVSLPTGGDAGGEPSHE